MATCSTGPLGSRSTEGSVRAHGDFTAIATIAFLVSCSNSMVAPLIPALAREFGVRPVDFKWLVPGFSAVYGIATLFYGVLSDRYGRNLVLRVLLVLSAVAILALSFAGNPDQFVFLRIVCAATTGGIATIANCVIGDRFPFAVQGRSMGAMFGAIVTGIGAGSSLATLLNPVFGWRSELRILAVAFGIAVLWIIQAEEAAPSRKVTESLWRYALEYSCIVESPRGGRALTLIFVNGAFHGGIFSWLGVLLASRYQLGDVGIGIALIGYGLPDLLLGGVVGSWGDRYGRRYIVPMGFIWASTCALSLAFRSTPLISAVTISALSLGYGATNPLLSSITTSLDPKHRGQITGLATFVNFLGVACGSTLFRELMIPHFGFALICFGCSQFSLGFLALYLLREERPTPGKLP